MDWQKYLAEHQDFWWKDFLKEIKPSDFEAVRELSNAVQANGEGHYGIAEKSSRHAAVLFDQERNHPGELRANFEEVYAHRRILNGADCIARADPPGKKALRNQLRLVGSARFSGTSRVQKYIR